MKHKIKAFKVIDYDNRKEASLDVVVELLNKITNIRLTISESIRKEASSANIELRSHYRHSIVPNENQRWVTNKLIIDRIEANWHQAILSEIGVEGSGAKYWFDVELAKELSRYVVQYATSVTLSFNHFILINNEIRVATIRGF